jgi:hypothetical protein
MVEQQLLGGGGKAQEQFYKEANKDVRKTLGCKTHLLSYQVSIKGLGQGHKRGTENYCAKTGGSNRVALSLVQSGVS